MGTTFRFRNDLIGDAKFLAVVGRQHQGFSRLPVKCVIMVGIADRMIHRHR